MAYRIEAVSVNHNTSAYLELMLRSLYATYQPMPELMVTVYDNASEDVTESLRAFAAARVVPITPSGFTAHTRSNSHGEILRRFLLERPDCTHYLFLDADVCFVETNTIPTMLQELEVADDAFGIGARQSWDGLVEIPEAVRRENPDICDARLHPCCAPVRNAPLFRRVAEEIGLGCARYLWTERDEYLDTLKLLTLVMRTHGRRHLISQKLVRHFFCPSYEADPALVRMKAERREVALADLRSMDTEPGPSRAAPALER